jgi:hypothetical protein
MNLPLEIKAQLSRLPADEATEIENFIANLPAHDFEIQNLLEECMDTLMAVLATKEPVHS